MKIKRKPIICRTPIVNRNPIIINKSQIHTNLVSNSCVLYNSHHTDKACASFLQSCNGTQFCVFDLKASMSQVKQFIQSQQAMPYTSIHVNSDSDLAYTKDLIQTLTDVNLPIIMSTSVSIPEDILNLMGRNPYNIIQAQMLGLGSEAKDYNTNSGYKHTQEVMEMMCDSKTYGIYVSLRIEPIVPRVTSTEQLLSLVSVAKNSCNHFSLKFVKVFRGKNEDEDFIYIDGVKIPKEFFTPNDNVWECCQEYVENTCNMIKMFAGNIPCSVCGQDPDCFGLELKTSQNDGGVFCFSETQV